mgnify:CR=1 FL=1
MKKVNYNQQQDQEASNIEAAIICTIVILICLFGNQLLDKLFF